MPPLFAAALPQVLVAIVVTSIFGALSYGLCRAIETRCRLFVYLATMVIVGACIGLWFVPKDIVSFCLINLVFCGVAAALGGWFHRLAGGASRNWVEGWSLCVVTTLISIIAGNLLVFPPGLPTPAYAKVSTAPIVLNCYFVGIATYPILAPLALWVWHSLKRRSEFDG